MFHNSTSIENPSFKHGNECKSERMMNSEKRWADPQITRDDSTRPTHGDAKSGIFKIQLTSSMLLILYLVNTTRARSMHVLF